VAIAVTVAVLGLGGAGAFVFSSPWKSNITVTDFSGQYGDQATLEACANGHFDLGVVGELFERFGMGPTDNGASECVVIAFTGELRPGRFVLSGDGHHLIGGGIAPFTPRPGHAPEVKGVTLTLSCFCSESDTPATFDGLLTLDEVSPPRGRLRLTVTTPGRPDVEVDASLRRFKWRHRGAGY
jgi:hypothetical protein